ncbi:hypothetical protein EMPG_10470 [Blastomyces silverae]|uniref:Uncharacterized protein n=1 Tax=Blastomyces silverae TaxID=2060906 RepID=A0A0H1BA29_9EURO|nr:hypothetical protein EMPG_10470 [Blastomyces silverae]
MSSSVTLLLLQPLHFYIYDDKKEIKVRDPSKYKSKMLSKYYSFTQALEWKFRLNLKFKTFLLNQIKDHCNCSFMTVQQFNSLHQQDNKNSFKFNTRFEEY